MNNNRRVVITGMGAITPLGNDVETFWSNLKNGVSGIRKIESFYTSAYDCRIGGEVRGFDPKTAFKNPKDVRRTDRFAQLAMAAAKMAMTDSAIEMANEDPNRFGVLVSSGIGGLKTLEDQYTILHSNAHQQHGERVDLDGIRTARTEHVYRHRLRHLEQRHRRILAHDQIW